jgi:hypothetical protein
MLAKSRIHLDPFADTSGLAGNVGPRLRDDNDERSGPHSHRVPPNIEQVDSANAQDRSAAAMLHRHMKSS